MAIHGAGAECSTRTRSCQSAFVSHRQGKHGSLRGVNAGIESVVNNGLTVIRNNRISHVGYTGIAGYHNPGWQNSVFSGNSVSDAPSVLVFDSQGAKRDGVPQIVFVGNVIEGNDFRNAVQLPVRYGGGTPPALWIDYATSGLPLTIANNMIRNNDFWFRASRAISCSA